MTGIVGPDFSLSALERFEACTGADELWDAFSRMVSPLAPQSAMFLRGVRFDDPQSACLDAQNNCELLMGSLVSDSFVAEVMGDEELRQIDYYSLYWRHSVTPWLFSCLNDDLEPPAVAPLNRVMNDYGVTSGLIVPLRGDGGHAFGTVSLTFDGESMDPAQVPISQLAAVCHYLNGYLDVAMDRPANGARLSARERDCLSLVATGCSTKRVSDRLSLSDSTVNEYIANARRKLDASSRSEAVAKAVKLGLIAP